jgi:hypothetical protein
MKNIFRYLNGGLIGMILEYLFRVGFNVWALIACLALILRMIMDLYSPKKKIKIDVEYPKEIRNKQGRTKDEQELHEYMEDNPR